VLHGAAARTNPHGWRKTLCFRYLPQVNSTNRFGYASPPELMERLTPERRQILTELATRHQPWDGPAAKSHFAKM